MMYAEIVRRVFPTPCDSLVLCLREIRDDDVDDVGDAADDDDDDDNDVDDAY